MALRSFVLLSAGCVGMTLAVTTETTMEPTTLSPCDDQDGCMLSTCDYWTYAYSCDTLEKYGCQCGGCMCSDAYADDWLDSPPDETTEIYGYIGGGFKNSVTGTFAYVGGGYQNRAIANYASIDGGFKGDAFARFSSILGGSRNTARGRFSIASGYMGDAMKDFTAAFAFNGETCAARSINDMAFCAKSFKFNDYELLDLFDRRRADEAKAEELQEVIQEQRKVIAAQNDRLATIESELLQRNSNNLRA